MFRPRFAAPLSPHAHRIAAASAFAYSCRSPYEETTPSRTPLASSFSYDNTPVDPPYLYTVIASFDVIITPPPFGVPDGTVTVDVPLKLLSTTNDPDQWPNNGTCYALPDFLRDGLPPAGELAGTRRYRPSSHRCWRPIDAGKPIRQSV